ncbi:MAG TPA: hypothetical protein VI796_07085 [Candidatus Thermoplasmatota archaeon]|nr:hypothetical protein [Candidatus Thermoplasmatota archaeon]
MKPTTLIVGGALMLAAFALAPGAEAERNECQEVVEPGCNQYSEHCSPDQPDGTYPVTEITYTCTQWAEYCDLYALKKCRLNYADDNGGPSTLGADAELG